MATVYDEVLGKNVAVHELVKPEEEREIVLKDPDVFAKLFETEEDEDE